MNKTNNIIKYATAVCIREKLPYLLKETEY